MNEMQSRRNSGIPKFTNQRKSIIFLPKNDEIFAANSVTELNDKVDYLIATCCAKQR